MSSELPTYMTVQDLPPAPPPKHVFIISGGIAAGKSTITRRLATDFHYVVGSPADALKETTAGFLSDLGIGDYETHFAAMQAQATKAEYRDLLVALGEFVSNRDNRFWASRCVGDAADEYENLAQAGIPSGIVFDSIRRPGEILEVKERWPQAKHVHLVVSEARQLEYLTKIIGNDLKKAVDILANASEHWLDDMDGTPYDADYVINADEGDDITWAQLMGVVVLMMEPTTLELAASITDTGENNDEV